MSGEKKPGVGLLVTQCVVTVTLLLTIGIVRLIGGALYEEWKNGWQMLMADNAWVDAAVTELFGETDGESTEVIP